MKTVGVCGNIKRQSYDGFVEAARKVYNVHDFAEDIGVTTMEDIRDCEKLYVIGKAGELSNDTWDIISWAYVTGVVIIPVNYISPHTIRFKAVEFLRTFASALESLE